MKKVLEIITSIASLVGGIAGIFYSIESIMILVNKFVNSDDSSTRAITNSHESQDLFLLNVNKYVFYGLFVLFCLGLIYIGINKIISLYHSRKD